MDRSKDEQATGVGYSSLLPPKFHGIQLNVVFPLRAKSFHGREGLRLGMISCVEIRYIRL